jgi:hypothetical protein
MHSAHEIPEATADILRYAQVLHVSDGMCTNESLKFLHNGTTNDISSHVSKRPLLLALAEVLLFQRRLVNVLALLVLARLDAHDAQTRQVETEHFPLLRLPLFVRFEDLRERLAQSAGGNDLVHVCLQQEVGDAPRELGVQALAEEKGEECEEVGEDGEGQDEEGIIERWGRDAL